MPTIEELKEEWEEYSEEIDLNIFDEFHINFPQNELNQLTLERYTNLTSEGYDYFAYWVETKTKNYGSGSGNSFKLGVYKPNYKNVKKTKLDNDENRIETWKNNAKEKYKTKAQETEYEEFVEPGEAKEYYEREVNPRLIALSNFVHIDTVEPLGINWSRKIAYLYNPGKMLSLYKNEVIKNIANFLGVTANTKDYKATEPLLNKLVDNGFIDDMPKDQNDALRLTLKLSNFLYEKFNVLEVVEEGLVEDDVEADNESTEGNDMDEPLNRILYGPPGTGKTRESIEQAAKIINNFREFKTYDDALDFFNEHLHDRIEFITFHQNYSYEEFVQGIRPDTNNETDLIFKLKDGIFKKLADKALENYKKPNERKNFVLVIDEINRANISRVFGELITLIEEDKRYGHKIQLSVKLPSGEDFIVPPNLFIIGTMNTADKSIALLDIALRRRFIFMPLYPKYNINGHTIHNVEKLKKINKKIIETKGHDFQIGHSYFMEDKNLKHLMDTKIIPLLLEYYMNDVDKVKEILDAAKLTTVQNKFPLEIEF
jgi:5-methylcytosine-specific restriction endonuclease McrBC GTP-binding regulatory subunit McrB